MFAPLHVGFEHPNLLWIAVAGLVAFVAGLGVNLYRSLAKSRPTESPVPEDGTE